MRDLIRSELATIEPFDALEGEHLADALAWVDSGVGLFRVAKPATPPKHVVSYFAVVDVDQILDGVGPRPSVERAACATRRWRRR
jgi:8-oxo-dGTP diphosphatase